MKGVPQRRRALAPLAQVTPEDARVLLCLERLVGNIVRNWDQLTVYDDSDVMNVVKDLVLLLQARIQDKREVLAEALRQAAAEGRVEARRQAAAGGRV